MFVLYNYISFFWFEGFCLACLGFLSKVLEFLQSMFLELLPSLFLKLFFLLKYL